MSIIRVRQKMSQDQAIDNLVAIFTSDYFRQYEINQSTLNTDIMNASELGGWKGRESHSVYTLEEIADVVVALLERVKEKGKLYDANIRLDASQEMLKARGFEEKFYEKDVKLRLRFTVLREGHPKSGIYEFNVMLTEFNREYFKEEGLKYRDANKRLKVWQEEVLSQLDMVLPYNVTK